MAQKRSSNIFSGIDEEKLAIGLGWFSIGLGIAELAAPRRAARFMGVKNRPALMRSLGLREVATGLGILTRKRPANWLWARVAGDAVDLAILGTSAAANHGSRGRATMATAAVAGVTALDWMCSRRISQRPEANLSRVEVRRAVTINRSPDELYRFWRDFENLPKFMNHLKSVERIDDKQSHWTARGPGGSSVEWVARIVTDRPDEMISWRSVAGDVDTSGSVRFEKAPGNRGTILHVAFEVTPPAGVLGSLVAKIFGESPTKQVAVDLLRLKQLIETGEIARTEGQAAGRPRSTSRKYDDFIRV
ncbi:MAG TPA: SRPBCC family protein [Verrucomicrobiae bacterium]|nr:SRPBCC family protein [Verrucomicrobiae bacterium]